MYDLIFEKNLAITSEVNMAYYIDYFYLKFIYNL